LDACRKTKPESAEFGALRNSGALASRRVRLGPDQARTQRTLLNPGVPGTETRGQPGATGSPGALHDKRGRNNFPERPGTKSERVEDGATFGWKRLPVETGPKEPSRQPENRRGHPGRHIKRIPPSHWGRALYDSSNQSLGLFSPWGEEISTAFISQKRSEPATTFHRGKWFTTRGIPG